MEGALQHVSHGAILAVLVFLVLKHLMGHSHAKSMTKAVFIGLVGAAYMIAFGHKLPGRINANLM
tara:strand:- start:5557 stop:5751 length:195 start_codon:yes stop_codon:yes gene_type:complete